MKVYQIFMHVSLEARAEFSFRARARAVNDTQNPTVGLGKDFQKKTGLPRSMAMALTRKQKEMSGWVQQMGLSRAPENELYLGTEFFSGLVQRESCSPGSTGAHCIGPSPVIFFHA